MLLVLGLALFVVAVAVAVLASSVGSGQTTGVAKSLELVNYHASRKSVAKNELAARDRLLDPMLGVLRGLAIRISPSGTGERIAHSLDKAGNPPTWSVERIMGLKGIGLVLGVVLGLVLLGFSFWGVLAAAAFGAFCFFLPDLLVYNAGLRRQQEMRRGLAD